MGDYDNGGGAVSIGSVNVVTTSNGGLSVEYWADRLLDRIVYVADDSDSIIKEQAIAFKEQIRQACIHYMKQAIKSDHTTLYSVLLQQGETEMAELIRRLN